MPFATTPILPPKSRVEFLYTTDYSQPAAFALLVLGLFVVIMGRYLLLAALFHFYFYVWNRDAWQHRQLGRKARPAGQERKEMAWSAATSVIFAIIGALSVVAWQKGYTAVYTDLNAYPLWYLPLSLALSMFIHETYYYWLHRLMHWPGLYRLVHRVHHDTPSTSAWTAFSFHPVEGFFEALIFPFIAVVLPLHPHVILVQLTIMVLSATINHLDIEIFPANALGTRLGRFVIGATHHGLHHRQYRFNYGLYFTFWDKWGKTESPQFKTDFEGRTKRGMD
ncbi:MAG: sterol desaturase family protein [Sphingobacteriaceae bacterium]|nr:sterol desaturase family protein [Cytophagaceae bacterium]